jgi:phosphatidylethanolamine/phosphatidyl-N-methylethanolamine N-methyltransferase
VFSTFAYIHALKMKKAQSFEKLLREKFKSVKRSKIVWGNLPPALVYHCSLSENILN